MALKGQAVQILATDTTLYTCPATVESSVHGLVVSNTTAGALSVTLKLYKQSLGTTLTVSPTKSIAAQDSYTWSKPINLNAGDYLVAVGSSTGLVALYSAYEGSATPVSVGFTGRGTWSSAASYVANDVVVYNGVTYLAIASSTNQTPNTATAYWMVSAAQGATGPTGPTGANSTVAGPTGPTGAASAVAGPTGPTGAASTVAGPTGPTGPTGAASTVTGPTGPTGAASTVAGPTGPTGAAGEVTLAGVQTLTNKTLTAPVLTGTRETRVVLAANAIDLATGNYFTKTISASTTFTVSNVPASGTAVSFILDLTNPGAFAITWFSGVKWAAGTAPTLTASGRDCIGFFSHDGGTTWSGFVLGKALA